MLEQIAVCIWPTSSPIFSGLPFGYLESERWKLTLRGGVPDSILPSRGAWPQATVGILAGLNFVAGCWGYLFIFKVFFSSCTSCTHTHSCLQ